MYMSFWTDVSSSFRKLLFRNASTDCDRIRQFVLGTLTHKKMVYRTVKLLNRTDIERGPKRPKEGGGCKPIF